MEESREFTGELKMKLKHCFDHTFDVLIEAEKLRVIIWFLNNVYFTEQSDEYTLSYFSNAMTLSEVISDYSEYLKCELGTITEEMEEACNYCIDTQEGSSIGKC